MLVQQLPIYNETRKFITSYVIVFEKMRNLHKHRIGAYIYDKSLNLPWFIKKANRNVSDTDTRNAYLEDFLDEVECIKNALRIAMDCRVIDIKTHARLSALIDGISKQATAWKGGKPGHRTSKDYGGDASFERSSGGNR